MKRKNILFYSKYKNQTKIKIALGLLIYVTASFSLFYNMDYLTTKFEDNAVYFYFFGMLLIFTPFALWTYELQQILVFPDHILIRVQHNKRITYDRYEFAEIFMVSFFKDSLLIKMGSGTEKKISTGNIECMSSRGLRVSWEHFAEDIQSRLKITK